MRHRSVDRSQPADGPRPNMAGGSHSRPRWCTQPHTLLAPPPADRDARCVRGAPERSATDCPLIAI
eukprot:1144748-Prymnesium_polylepis.2